MKHITLLVVAGLLSASVGHALTTAYSPPVGGMTVVVPAGQTRTFAIPLLHSHAGSGALLGKITGVGTNYVDVTGANWTAGALSQASNPYYLRFRTGAMAGRAFLVSTTANTDTRVFLTTDSVDLVVSGVVAGDAYELVLADTLGSLFGSTALQGGSDATVADNVLVWANTAWVRYYYNTARFRWERSTDTAASAPRDNFVLRPDRGLMVTRRAATDWKFYVTGRVPEVGGLFPHSRPGVTFISTGLPTDITLGDLGINTRAPGWITATSSSGSSTADLIQVWSNTAWTNYYYDSGRSSWQRTTDTAASTSRNGVVLPAGRPIMIRRVNSATGTPTLIGMPKNYTIAQ